MKVQFFIVVHIEKTIFPEIRVGNKSYITMKVDEVKVHNQ